MTTGPQAQTSERERLIDWFQSSADCWTNDKEFTQVIDMLRADAEKIRDLQAKLAAREADAERYRWLREKIEIRSQDMVNGARRDCFDIRIGCSVVGASRDVRSSYLSESRFDAECKRVDAAIDAALSPTVSEGAIDSSGNRPGEGEGHGPA